MNETRKERKARFANYLCAAIDRLPERARNMFWNYVRTQGYPLPDSTGWLSCYCNGLIKWPVYRIQKALKECERFTTK